MITQYPWISVKNQERKHIEIGAMVTLLAAIISFYSVPDFAARVIIEKPYVPPPVEVLSIPATIQPPEVLTPQRPTLPVESENDDIVPPPPQRDPTVPFYAIEVKPAPIGGLQAIINNAIYPPIAIEARQEGKVVVDALIGIDGIVKEVRVLKGMPGTGLDDAAMAAVLKTPFSPAYQRDKPVQVRMAIPVDFRLR
jgi:protein TonB